MIRSICVLVVLGAPLSYAQGMLLPTDKAVGPLGIKYQRVSAEIIDGAAVTKVEQVFVNASPRQLEAHYVFPLPKGAALQDFYLWINGKKTKGEVLEKQKATEIYEGIVRRLQDPGLLEYIDSDAFRARVFPVPANGEQRIELTFSPGARLLGRASTSTTTRWAPRRGARRCSPVKQDFTFSAVIKSKTPLQEHLLADPPAGRSHARATRRRWRASRRGRAATSRRTSTSSTRSPTRRSGCPSCLTAPDTEQPGFFMALISPKTEVKPDEVIAKRVTFVIDTSGSMTGERMKMAKRRAQVLRAEAEPAGRVQRGALLHRRRGALRASPRWPARPT